MTRAVNDLEYPSTPQGQIQLEYVHAVLDSNLSQFIFLVNRFTIEGIFDNFSKMPLNTTKSTALQICATGCLRVPNSTQFHSMIKFPMHRIINASTSATPLHVSP